jgi:hypothetical protein
MNLRTVSSGCAIDIQTKWRASVRGRIATISADRSITHHHKVLAWPVAAIPHVDWSAIVGGLGHNVHALVIGSR